VTGVQTCALPISASVSQNGVLVNSGGLGPIQLAWHNREGTREAAIGEPGIYGEIDLSPDERRLALKRKDLVVHTGNEHRAKLALVVLLAMLTVDGLLTIRKLLINGVPRSSVRHVERGPKASLGIRPLVPKNQYRFASKEAWPKVSVFGTHRHMNGDSI